MDDVPLEIVTKILMYLPKNDRLRVASVNKKFHNASLYPKLIMNDVFSFTDTLFSIDGPKRPQLRFKYHMFSEMLQNSKRSIINLKFDQVFLNTIEYVRLIDNLGVRIVSLSLVGLNMLSDTLLESITFYCDNLNALEFENIKTFSITVKLRKKLLKLSHITFNGLGISDVAFNQIVQCAPNLKHFGLNGCNLIEEHKILIRHYPNYKNPQSSRNYNSRSVFTIININNFLQTCKSIESLKLDYYRIIKQLPKHIKLKTLEMDSMLDDAMCSKKFIEILGEHTLLERLDLNLFPCTILMAVSKMHNLKYLKLKYICEDHLCHEDTNSLRVFIDSMKDNLKHIRELIIVPAWNPPEICANEKQIPDCILNSLTLLECSFEYCKNVVYMGKNLTTLRMLNCQIMTSSDFISLFHNLTNLIHIELANCTNLDDDVFLAMNISNVKGLVTLKITDANLTYKCLKGTKLLYLKDITISKLSKEGHKDDKDYDDDDLSILDRVKSVVPNSMFATDDSYQYSFMDHNLISLPFPFPSLYQLL